MPDNCEPVRQGLGTIIFAPRETWIGSLILNKASEIGIRLTLTDRGQAGRKGFILYFPKRYSEILGITIAQIRLNMMMVGNERESEVGNSIGYTISTLVESNLKYLLH